MAPSNSSSDEQNVDPGTTDRGMAHMQQDPEMGHGPVSDAPSGDESTLCHEGVDLARYPTQKDTADDMTTSDSSTLYPESEDGECEQNRRGNALLRVKTETWKKWSSNPRKGMKVTTKHFYQEVDSSWTAVMVVTCFFVAGLIDAVAYSNWGTFVSMQTGNTVLVALRIVNKEADHHPLSYLKNLISIGAFWLGCICFNVLHRAPAGLSKGKVPLHRWTLFTGFIVQACLWSASAIMATVGVIHTATQTSGTSEVSSISLSSWLDLIPIGLLAFESAGQVCVSRVLILNDLPTVAISTLYHDFIGDLFTIHRVWRESATFRDFLVTQKKQARRFSSCLGIFLGALLGGYVDQSKAGLKGCLWIGMGCKAALGFAWIFWKKKVVTETVVTTRPRANLQQTRQEEKPSAEPACACRATLSRAPARIQFEKSHDNDQSESDGKQQ